MIDHIGLVVADIGRARAFYERALAPLGYAVVMDVTPDRTGGTTHLGFGTPARPWFWLSDAGQPSGAVHVAFAAASRSLVDAFHAAALAAGGRDNGAPGFRPHYHPAYYGAFVLDPDGHNIEAVCHRPE